jgi:hypothetical protein
MLAVSGDQINQADLEEWIRVRAVQKEWERIAP